MLHHEGISEEMFENAALSVLELEDSELQKEVTQLLNQLGKRDSAWSSWNFQQVVNCLGAHSLIEYDRQNCTYSLHPLVQQWSGTTIDDENRHVMRKCVISIIGLSISWTFSEEDYRYRRTLLKHINNTTALLEPGILDPSIASHLALAYFEQGYWNRAERFQVVVKGKMKQLLGDSHPDTLGSMANLANTYGSQGRWNDAEVLQVAVMEKRKQLLGDSHPDTFRSMGNLANTYRGQGRWKDAEVLQVMVMEKRKQLLRDSHTLRSMANLANTYQSQGRWNDAEVLQVAVMEKRRLLRWQPCKFSIQKSGSTMATWAKRNLMRTSA